MGSASWATGAAKALLQWVSCLVLRNSQMEVLPSGEESSDDGDLHFNDEVGFFEDDRERLRMKVGC